jgi:hypothetical protein
MVITQNYFTINKKLKSILFTDLVSVQGLFCLNYYNFNILLSQTKNQNTVYHTIGDEFFDEFSTHKNKMTFCGVLNNDTFTFTEINYQIPEKKMGIYVRKRLINGFKDKGIHLMLKKNSAGNDKVTRLFVL